MKRAKAKKRIFVALLVTVCWLFPECLSAQGGALGNPTGSFTHQSFGSDYTGSFTHQSFGSDYTGNFTHQSFGSNYTGNFTHQSFGSDFGGLFNHQSFGSNYEGNFTHQSFGDSAPLGSGLFVLLSAGMGYAAWKRKKQQINKKN